MNLARRAATVSAWTLASRVLGLVRDRLWAGTMGGSLVLDAFLAAFALPNLLRNLFGEGALSAAVIPRYVQLRQSDPAAAEAFAGLVLARLTLVLSLIAAVGMAGCAAWMWWLGPEFGLKAFLVVALALPQIPYCVFICVGAVAGGILNGRRHFWVPAAAPVMLNLSMIATVGLAPEDEAWLMPYAVLGGGILQLGVHLWALRRTGGVPPLLFASTPAWRELRTAWVPNLLAGSLFQINAFLDTVIAMAFIPGSGAVSYLYFANRLLQFPMALIGHGVTTAAYPELAAAASEGWAATGERLRAATRLQAFWLFPAAVGLVVCAEPLVRTIYQTGAFGDAAVARTVLVTRMLGLALVPISLSKLVVRAFHAHRDQRTPLRISLLVVGLNLMLNLILVQTPLQEAGLALATALCSFLALTLYGRHLRRHGAGAMVAWSALWRPGLAALAMGVAVEVFLQAWPQPAGRASGYAALRLAAAVVLGAAVYLGIAGVAWLRRKKSP